MATLNLNTGLSMRALQERIAELEAANAALKASKTRAMSLKVTEKGGLSVYGLGRFPVTLYRGQWERLLAHAGEIEAFIAANAASLSVKE